MARGYRKLTSIERKKIADLYDTGIPRYQIANALGRSLSTIAQELRRGYTGQTDQNGRPEYNVDLAKERLHQNLHQRGKGKVKVPKLEGQESFCEQKAANKQE